MEATIKNINPIVAASGNTYHQIFFNEDEYANKRIITFTKDKLEVGQKLEFTQKENLDGSFVITPKKPFNGFNKAQTTDYKVEALKATVELIKAGIIKPEQLKSATKRIYNTLNEL
jgi:hypothetical protein